MEQEMLRIPFLSQVASCFYKEYGAKISRLAFVFPNRRAGLFFRKYLSEVAGKPMFSPTILTISDLFDRLSDKRVMDRIPLLFKLYDLYVKHSGTAETFDEFFYWGEMLLNDFDDVDKYMVDARMLFTNVTELGEIEKDFSFLEEEQIEAIRMFWSSFYPKGADSLNQTNFLSVWRILYDLYMDFKVSLSEEKQGYEGMIFREVVEKIQRDESVSLPFDKAIFVCLNALSVVEERLLILLRDKGKADFYWDYDSPMVNDPANKASFFVERNRKLFPSFYDLGEDTATAFAPEMEVIGVSSGIGQAKQVCDLLSDLLSGEVMNPEKALRTAVVLPDERMLVPLLNSIPEQIERINVTMGYPLSGTPVASLMESVLALQKNIRVADGQARFYYRDVLPVLNHRYVMRTAPEVIASMVSDMNKLNKVYISDKDLSQTPLLSKLFVSIGSVDFFSDYLIDILGELNRATTDDLLAGEFIFHYFTAINRLKESITKSAVLMQTDTYLRLLKRLIGSISIPFEGEPLSGLQIMGVLETRALDFDRLIILSMNEGVFPARETSNSFIPYNLRRAFELPAYEHQDSVWAYHFYRLIHRASHVSFLYDTRTTGMQTGEVSRFVHQLTYLYGVKMCHKTVVYDVSSSKSVPITIAKTEKVRLLLAKFFEEGSRSISASAVNTYLDCPLKFYFSVVEAIKEEDEVSETIGSDLFGSILHKVMEDIYRPLLGKMVTADVLKAIVKDKEGLEEIIAHAFSLLYFKADVTQKLLGQNYLIGEMIRKYVERVLTQDRKLTPFRYRESERLINTLLPLRSGRKIRLKGFIDRMDEVNGHVRIIDYKSGSGTTVFATVDSLFGKEEKERAKAVMQVFMYSWMYGATSGNRSIRPQIYYMRTLFGGSFDPSIYRRIERAKTESVDDFSVYYEPFEDKLRECLEEIFESDTPFVQTSISKACGYCEFKDICGK